MLYNNDKAQRFYPDVRNANTQKSYEEYNYNGEKLDV
jgi:hypothetical protein